MNLADCKKDSDAVHESVQRKTLKRHVGCFDASAYKVGHYICSRLHDVPVNLPDEAAYLLHDRALHQRRGELLGDRRFNVQKGIIFNRLYRVVYSVTGVIASGASVEIAAVGVNRISLSAGN